MTSSLGKGILCASLAKLHFRRMDSRSLYKKFDPYLNV
ncbi:MAG: hypothetical protein R2778_01440 [Saprospiraceae bacterium]